jgi:hypothetical protein
VPIDGQVLAELREDQFWTHGQLAEQAQAFAKSQNQTCALARTQIVAYEAARLDNPRSLQYPSRENLRYLVGALRPTMADLTRLLGRTPPRALAQWTTDAVKPNETAPHPSDGACEQAQTTAATAKKPPVNRRKFTTKVPPTIILGACVALPRPTDPLRAEIDEVTGAYTTSSPQKLLPRARRLLNKIMRMLGQPMRDGARRRLLVDASEVAAVAGWTALFGNHHGEADAYFTQALKFAAQSGVDRALGCAFASAAMVHGVNSGSGDSATALGMLQAAESLLPARGLMTKVVVLRQAEELAALEDDEHRYAGLKTLERGEHIDATDDDEGFYAQRSHLSFNEAFLCSWAGRIEVRLGRANEGLARLHQWTSEPVVNMRTPAVRLADVALGHTAARDPEPACTAAIRSLDASQAVGYLVGMDRVRRVRDSMPREWAPLDCVRELDERLRILP